ncbi:MAG: S8 family peptidase [Bacteroidetes bacterium]|nr:S8 family peptidase [Bacteroidota bacterium]
MHIPIVNRIKFRSRIAGCLLFLFISQISAGQDFFSRYALSGEHSFNNQRPYYICSWDETKSPPQNIIRQLDARTAIIKVVDQAQLEAIHAVQKMAPANNDWKISFSADRFFTTNSRAKKIFILTSSNTNALKEELANQGEKVVLIGENELANSILVLADADWVKHHIIPLPDVIFADIRVEPHTETNIIGYNRSFHGINAVDYLIPGANGKNRVVGVKEQRMEPTDLDLYKRVLNSTIAAPATEYHATVISSIIGGSGNSFYDGRGIAWGCSFFSSTFANLFTDNLAVLNASNVSVQNHSYGTIIQSFYGAEAVSYDAQTWLNKNILHVFSSGNSGIRSATDGRYANLPGFANITGNFKAAKNILTIGAIDNKGNIPAESSAGPLYDGRIAPQLVALGTNGTSDAAAIVSGTIAVLQQVYADSNSQQLPPASLVKALLYNTTDDVNTAGIDYKTGYGMLNSYGAIRALQQKQYATGSVAQGQQWSLPITVPANTAQVRITLAWTDSTAGVNNNKALVNDADLELVQLSTGTVYKPWVLSVAANADSLRKEPIRKRDSLNTAEQVSISLPNAGNYLVRVNGTAIATNNLLFHVAIQTDTLNTFHFTSPIHASDINRVENANLDIRWKTFVADTNTTGDLYISYNNGTSWQLLKSAHKVYTNLYRWPVKDTASTGRLKMETGFGDFFSADFIISPVIRPVVDFLCADSFRLSWNKHVYANSYRLYTLIDSPYLKPILNVTDSFVVLNRTSYPNSVYAVEPVLSNGLPAARSVAYDITQQGVKCFYKTFYYTLQDENKLDLILELSIASYTDSIYFERVTGGGGLLQTAGGLKVNGTGLIYQLRINEIPSGTSYWRARIRLKNGATVYSEIISLLSSGKQKIIFYPNPSGRNTTVNYVLLQGIPNSSRLQLLDMSGRLVRSYTEMPGIIKAGSLPAGLYFYRLLTADGTLLDAGKLIMQ